MELINIRPPNRDLFHRHQLMPMLGLDPVFSGPVETVIPAGGLTAP
jgi:hypothetical protein